MTTVQEPLNGSSSPSFFKSLFSKLKPPREVGASAANVYPQDELRGAKEVRCRFTFSDGRQCRSQRASFCVHHASKRDTKHKAPAAPDLEVLCTDLTTATSINRALAQIFLLMAQGRISRKDAVAFGYLGQLLLQTAPGVRAEFVSAFGYHDWEENLTTRLKSSGAAKGC